MADQWFVQRDGQKFGPFSPAQLKQMTTTGQLLPVDLVSKGEGGKWVAASQIKGLFAAATAKQPPPAPMPAPMPGATTGPLPPPVPTSPFDFGSGPPPVPVTQSGTSVEIVDRKVIPTNPVAMALLSGLILIPVGHFLMGQVLKAVVVLFAAPWLMVAVGTATGGLGFPVVMLAYAVVMGTDAYLLALRRSAGDPVGPWDTPVVGKLLGAKGLLPARIALPILGMLLVVGSGLCLSLFGVKVALFDDSDLRNQLLIAFSLFHCVFAVIAIVLTARLQHAVAAPAAAVLTMTAWGWYCFATIPPIASILGLLAGISIGAWALWTFRQPDVKAMFADTGKPGPLDRLGMPVLAGSAVGLLVLILGVGGVLYAVARDKSATTTGNNAGGFSFGDPPAKKSSGTRRPGKTYLDDVIAEKGRPTGSYASLNYKNQFVHVWKAGSDEYDLVFTAINPATDEPEYVTNTQDGFSQVRLDAFLKGYRRK